MRNKQDCLNIAEDLSRYKVNIKEAIESNYVDVPESAKLSTYHTYIDDIVKKIDQKIAELEAEEKREQEEQKKKEQQANVDNSVPVQQTGISPTPQVNSDVTDIYNKTVTDDQFFDDFFDE